MAPKRRNIAQPIVPTLSGDNANQTVQEQIINDFMGPATGGYYDAIVKVAIAFLNVLTLQYTAITEFIERAGTSKQAEYMQDWYMLYNRCTSDKFLAVALCRYVAHARVKGGEPLANAIFKYIILSSVRSNINSAVIELQVATKKIDDQARLGYDPARERIITSYYTLRAERHRMRMMRVNKLEDLRQRINDMISQIWSEHEKEWGLLDEYAAIIKPSEEQKEQWILQYFAMPAADRAKVAESADEYVQYESERYTRNAKETFFKSDSAGELCKKLQGMNLDSTKDQLLDEIDYFLDYISSQPEYSPDQTPTGRGVFGGAQTPRRSN